MTRYGTQNMYIVFTCNNVSKIGNHENDMKCRGVDYLLNVLEINPNTVFIPPPLPPTKQLPCIKASHLTERSVSKNFHLRF